LSEDDEYELLSILPGTANKGIEQAVRELSFDDEEEKETREWLGNKDDLIRNIEGWITIGYRSQARRYFNDPHKAKCAYRAANEFGKRADTMMEYGDRVRIELDPKWAEGKATILSPNSQRYSDEPRWVKSNSFELN
jgi:hypothetical protein